MSTHGPAVEVSDVAAGLGREPAVQGITFGAEAGETLALFGCSGSGKTTLLRVLAGGLRPTSGFVRILGAAASKARKRIGFAPDCARFPGLLTANQTLAASLLRFGVPASQRPARAAEALDLVDLYDVRDRQVRELSGGQQRALGIARAIAHRPAVLLLDNVTFALAEPVRKRMWSRLQERCRTDGLTVVFATTISTEAEAADRVLLLDGGRVLACGPPEALLNDLDRETVTVEALDPALVRRTLRGLYDVEIEDTPEGVRLQPADGLSLAAHLFRHPAESVRAVYVRRPTLWDVIERLRR